eukprot:8361192-Pyramimonas_sp.AAC.1
MRWTGGVFDASQDSVDQLYRLWADQAEDEVAVATGTKLPFRGSRGKAPALRWKSILAPDTQSPKQPVLFAHRWRNSQALRLGLHWEARDRAGVASVLHVLRTPVGAIASGLDASPRLLPYLVEVGGVMLDALEVHEQTSHQGILLKRRRLDVAPGDAADPGARFAVISRDFVCWRNTFNDRMQEVESDARKAASAEWRDW